MELPGSYYDSVGGYILTLSRGVTHMQYVTYGDLFQFSIVMIELATFFVAVFCAIKKN